MFKASFFYRGFIFLAFIAYMICFVLAVVSIEENYWDSILTALATPISFTIFIAFFAVAFALENYLRKTDLNISGRIDFYKNEITKSGFSHDIGVSSFELNNYKDKTVVIYRVYLYLNEGFYIELVNSENEPILLKAYDTYYKDFKRPLFYYLENKPKNLKNVNFSKTKLYLDTNEGKYKVKKRIEKWKANCSKTLVPKIPMDNYDFNVRFYFRARSFLGMSSGETYKIEYDQKNLQIDDIEIDVTNICTINDLHELLNKKLPKANGYDIWSPIEGIKVNYPDWEKSTKLDIGRK